MRHGASKGAGWGKRIHNQDGTSWLNSFSGGDVVVFDTQEEAEEDARNTREIYGSRNVSIEYVEKGAWTPSDYDRVLIDLIEFTMAFASSTDSKNANDAIRAVNKARTMLSWHAPESLRNPSPLRDV